MVSWLRQDILKYLFILFLKRQRFLIFSSFEETPRRTIKGTKKEPRTHSAVEQMGFPVSGCGTRGFAAQTVLARDDTEKPHLLPTAPAIVRPTNTPPLVVADMRNGFNNDLLAHFKKWLVVGAYFMYARKTWMCTLTITKNAGIHKVCPYRDW